MFVFASKYKIHQTFPCYLQCHLDSLKEITILWQKQCRQLIKSCWIFSKPRWNISCVVFVCQRCRVSEQTHLTMCEGQTPSEDSLGHHPAACCSSATNTHTNTLHIHTFVLSGRCTLFSRGSTEGEMENYLEHYLQTFVLYDFSPFLALFFLLHRSFFFQMNFGCIVSQTDGVLTICSQTAIRQMEKSLIFQKFLA